MRFLAPGFYSNDYYWSIRGFLERYYCRYYNISTPWQKMSSICWYNIPKARVADPDPNPALFGRIRIRKIFTGSGSESGSYRYRYFGNIKLYEQGKIIEVLHIFKWIFQFFQIKIIIIQISEEILVCLNWFLKCGASRIRDPNPILKFWFAGSGSGRKWTGSATLPKKLFHSQELRNK